jgi:hypothetical protein
MKKDKKIKAYTMLLKPKLNGSHHSKHLYHCISKIDRNTLNGVSGLLKYTTFCNEVHVDEKWFYLVQDHGCYYLTANEAPLEYIIIISENNE